MGFPFAIHTPPCGRFTVSLSRGVWFQMDRCACDIHEVCMWYPCGVHVIPMWCVCDIQVSNELFQLPSTLPLWKIYCKSFTGECDFQMDRCACDIHVVCIWYPCGVYVISMWVMSYSNCHPHSPCERFTASLSRGSMIFKWIDVHVIPARCACDIHVVCMWYLCGVYVISN